MLNHLTSNLPQLPQHPHAMTSGPFLRSTKALHTHFRYFYKTESRFSTCYSAKMRLPYVPNPPPTPGPDSVEQAIVERVTARRAPRPLQPLDLALLHSPHVADGWNSFLGAVRTKTSLGDDVREIAICRVAVCNGVSLLCYVLGCHYLKEGIHC
jgi:hypothetical protein